MNQERQRLHKRLDALSPARRRLLAERLALNAGVAQSSTRGLLAVVSGRSGTLPDVIEVRDYLSQRLPDYMLPRVVPVADGLPRTPAGKIDRVALSFMDLQSEPAGAGDRIEARNEAESILTDIWGEVLGVSELGVEDDFFELGGDSLLSIRILARARQRGLVISPEHFFAHPTIAGQAAAAEMPGAVRPESVPSSGVAPLTPIQHWFITHTPVDPQHWNQSVVLSIRDKLDTTVLERGLQQLLLHHEGLRLLLQRDGAVWRQRFGSPGAELPLAVVELESMSLEELEAKIDATANQWHEGLDLENGPLIRLGLFRTPEQTPDRLLLLAHHLLVDAVSWQVLVEDLATALGQLQRGQTVELPEKTGSCLAWAKYLADLAASDELSRQVDWWLAQGRKPRAALPLDHDASPDENRVSSVSTVGAGLGREDTAALINDVPKVYHTQILDILLAAFSTVIGRWVGGDYLQVDLERHGRYPLSDAVDVSRTVGWFTSVFPVWLPCTGAAGDRIKLTKETLRDIPLDGLSHGLLRYLSPAAETREALAEIPDSEICFNYLGQRGSGGGLLVVEQEGGGRARSPQGIRAYLLEVNLWVAGGRLESSWAFSERFHSAEKISRLAQAFMDELSSLITHCRGPEAGGHTPSDFPLADLDQNELDDLSALLDQIDDD